MRVELEVYDLSKAKEEKDRAMIARVKMWDKKGKEYFFAQLWPADMSVKTVVKIMEDSIEGVPGLYPSRVRGWLHSCKYYERKRLGTLKIPVKKGGRPKGTGSLYYKRVRKIIR